MIEVEKRYNRVTKTFDILLKSNDKTFKLSYEGNLDYYWLISGKHYDYVDNEYGYYAFVLTKENYFLYDAFDKLYSDIINAKLFDEDILGSCRSYHEYLKEKMRIEKWQEEEKRFSKSSSLVENGIITWLSDDACLDEDDFLSFLYPATYVQIKKDEDAIYLEFKIKLMKNISNIPISVRFRTNGSRYRYFYIPFALIYQSLQNYEITNQIHIEEYLYLTKKK